MIAQKIIFKIKLYKAIFTAAAMEATSTNSCSWYYIIFVSELPSIRSTALFLLEN
jgi:hypothetical protein